MANVRTGSAAALLVVDVQVGVVKNTWEADRIVANVGSAVQRARSRGVPVIWIQHADEELAQESPDWEIVPELVPLESERRLRKAYNSAFEATGLEEELAHLGISHLILTGLATNWCIRATAYGALERGYDLTLVEDAHTTESLSDGDRVIEAADIVEELNTCMMYVSYPDRTSRIALAEEVFR
jgi:nicotinamidase-related amidase